MSEILDNRATELRLGPKGRAVFTAKGWNDALRAAGVSAGWWWIGAYLPMRYNTGYAMRALGYRPKGLNRQRVLAGEPPFVETGAMAGRIGGARVEAVAKKGGARFWVVVPVGHPLVAHMRRAFGTLPPAEQRGIAKAYRRAIIAALMLRRTEVAAKRDAKIAVKQARRAAWKGIMSDAKAYQAGQRSAARAQLRADRAAVRSAAQQLRRRRAFGSTITFAA